jgi:hypothetical protein
MIFKLKKIRVSFIFKIVHALKKEVFLVNETKEYNN